MIRKILIFTVLAVVAAAALVLPLGKSDAAQQPTSVGSPQGSARRTLPNFDIRQIETDLLPKSWPILSNGSVVVGEKRNNGNPSSEPFCAINTGHPRRFRMRQGIARTWLG